MANPTPIDPSQTKYYRPFVSAFDPCPPMLVKSYQTAPNLYIRFQPADLPQYSPKEALFRGTLWPALFSTYYNRAEREEGAT